MLKELTQWPTNIYRKQKIPCPGNISRAFFADRFIKCFRKTHLVYIKVNLTGPIKVKYVVHDAKNKCLSSKVLYVSAASTGGWFASKTLQAKRC